MSAIFEGIKEQIVRFESTLPTDKEIGVLFTDYKFGKSFRATHIWEVDSNFIVFYGKANGVLMQIMQPLTTANFVLLIEEVGRRESNRVIFTAP